MTQAFAYQHLVPAKDWTVMVSSRGGGVAKTPVQFLREEKVRFPAGKTAKIYVLAPGMNPSEIRVELSDPPDGLTVQSVGAEGKATAIVLHADAEKLKAGLKGNLIFNAFLEQTRTYTKKEEKKPVQIRTLLGMLPAVPFEITTK